ncbi:MAG: ATP-dependent sacrificial sulfur transferase LarE [Planctomycetes bacterium]|nr:ATP-dependent sacrificial sulfur transferase LarE [Planctomycetota bacterium]
MIPEAASLPYEQKLAHLRRSLGALPGAVVAFSAGVDSTALLHACRQALGERLVAVTADSPSLPRAELADAVALAAELAVRHVVLATDELSREGYVQNEGDRCYHCKQELFVTVAARRAELDAGAWPVLYGAITDDLGDHRPGQRAAAEHGVLAPLVDAGFGKPDVRRYCRDHGVRVADKPSMACLSSRVPYGTPIDRQVLQRVEQAEAALRARGFRQFRVRHHDQVARLEFADDELPRAFSLREVLGRDVQAAGYTFVAFDAFGYRSGSLNRMLQPGDRTMQPGPLHEEAR